MTQRVFGGLTLNEATGNANNFMDNSYYSGWKVVRAEKVTGEEDEYIVILED